MTRIVDHPETNPVFKEIKDAVDGMDFLKKKEEAEFKKEQNGGGDNNGDEF